MLHNRRRGESKSDFKFKYREKKYLDLSPLNDEMPEIEELLRKCPTGERKGVK